jgi:hypothetical protein
LSWALKGQAERFLNFSDGKRTDSDSDWTNPPLGKTVDGGFKVRAGWVFGRFHCFNCIFSWALIAPGNRLLLADVLDGKEMRP